MTSSTKPKVQDGQAAPPAVSEKRRLLIWGKTKSFVSSIFTGVYGMGDGRDGMMFRSRQAAQEDPNAKKRKDILNSLPTMRQGITITPEGIDKKTGEPITRLTLASAVPISDIFSNMLPLTGVGVLGGGIGGYWSASKQLYENLGGPTATSWEALIAGLSIACGILANQFVVKSFIYRGRISDAELTAVVKSLTNSPKGISAQKIYDTQVKIEATRILQNAEFETLVNAHKISQAELYATGGFKTKAGGVKVIVTEGSIPLSDNVVVNMMDPATGTTVDVTMPEWKYNLIRHLDDAKVAANKFIAENKVAGMEVLKPTTPDIAWDSGSIADSFEKNIKTPDKMMSNIDAWVETQIRSHMQTHVILPGELKTFGITSGSIDTKKWVSSATKAIRRKARLTPNRTEIPTSELLKIGGETLYDALDPNFRTAAYGSKDDFLALAKESGKNSKLSVRVGGWLEDKGVDRLKRLEEFGEFGKKEPPYSTGKILTSVGRFGRNAWISGLLTAGLLMGGNAIYQSFQSDEAAATDVNRTTNTGNSGIDAAAQKQAEEARKAMEQLSNYYPELKASPGAVHAQGPDWVFYFRELPSNPYIKPGELNTYSYELTAPPKVFGSDFSEHYNNLYLGVQPMNRAGARASYDISGFPEAGFEVERGQISHGQDAHTSDGGFVNGAKYTVNLTIDLRDGANTWGYSMVDKAGKPMPAATAQPLPPNFMDLVLKNPSEFRVGIGIFQK